MFNWYNNKTCISWNDFSTNHLGIIDELCISLFLEMFKNHLEITLFLVLNCLILAMTHFLNLLDQCFAYTHLLVYNDKHQLFCGNTLIRSINSCQKCISHDDWIIWYPLIVNVLWYNSKQWRICVHSFQVRRQILAIHKYWWEKR